MKELSAAVSGYHNKNLADGESRSEQGAVLSIGGNSKVIAEQGNITFKGTTLVSENNIDVYAGKDMNITTAETRTRQSGNQRNYGKGEAVISDTERFSGYNRQINNQDGTSITHNQSQLASLSGNLSLYAGKHFNQKSGQLLAKNNMAISAEEIAITAAHNQLEENSHSSDLKIGNFSRVSSPIIDLVNTAEKAYKTVKDNEATDRLKAAQLLGLAAQGYTLANSAKQVINGNREPMLLRVESGVGVAHGRSDSQLKSQESVANTLNAKHITLQARGGDINIEHADLTSRDSNGNRLANSSITLDALKDIHLTAGTDFYKQTGKSQNIGVEVGTAFSVGAKTGWSVYGKVGYGNNQSGDEHTAYQNTFIDTETLTLKSGANTTLRGATALANTINTEIGKQLTIESLQDEHHQTSRGVNAGLQVEFGLGTAWDFRLSGSGNRANSHFQQVGKQSGLFAEDGGYHINADTVTLTGGAIASTNPDKSELTTNRITFTDIRNKSHYSASTASVSGAYGNDPYSGKDITGVSPSIPMYESGNDNSLTKATLTEGKITLNKDTAPTQTTATALGINTEINLANHQVETPKDINRVLYEQGKISEAVGGLSSAVETYAANKRSEAEIERKRAENERGKAITRGDKVAEEQANNAILIAKAKQESWEIGGSHYQTAKTISAVTGALLSGQSTAQVATAALSPTANNLIHEATQDSKIANLLAHAILSAVEFKVAGLDGVTGAMAGVAGEGAAMLLAETVYNKPIEALSQSEKELLKTASMIAGGLVAGTASNGSVTANMFEGMATAERAVENNFLSQAEYAELNRLMNKKVLTPEEAFRVKYLLEKDKVSDRLLATWQANPESLDQRSQELLFKWIREYGNVPEQMRLVNMPTTTPQMKPDYSALNQQAQKVYNYSSGFQGRMDESLTTGISTIGAGGLGIGAKAIASTAGKTATKIGELAHKYPKISGAITDGAVSTGTHIGYKLGTGQELNEYEVLGAFASGALTRNHTVGNQIRINIGIATVSSLSKDPSGNSLSNDYWGAVTSPLTGKVFETIKYGGLIGSYTSEFVGDIDNRKKDIKEFHNKIIKEKE